MVKLCKNCTHQKSLHKYKGHVKEQCTCEGYYNEPACDCTQFEEQKKEEL